MSTGIASQPPRGILSRLNAFFYSEEVPYGLALMRISISIALLLAMVPRWGYARELYSSDGSPVPVWEIYGLKPLFTEPSAEAAIAIHSVLLLACLTSCLGWCTRFSMILAAAGYIYLNSLDTIGTMNKYSVIASHLMLLMCFSDCGAIWSLDNWFRRSRLRRAGVPPEIANQPRRSAAWPRRLLQLCVGLVYFGAVLTKVKIPAYFSGEQLQTWMITNYNMPNLLGRYFEPYPAILAAFGLIALVWECTFIFLAWRGIPRIIMLAIGSTFHIMTLLTLGLWLFPVVCISSYLAFLNEADVAWFKQLFALARTRWGIARDGGRVVPLARVAIAPASQPGLGASGLWRTGAGDGRRRHRLGIQARSLRDASPGRPVRTQAARSELRRPIAAAERADSQPGQGPAI